MECQHGPWGWTNSSWQNCSNLKNLRTHLCVTAREWICKTCQWKSSIYSYCLSAATPTFTNETHTCSLARKPYWHTPLLDLRTPLCQQKQPQLWVLVKACTHTSSTFSPRLSNSGPSYYVNTQVGKYIGFVSWNLFTYGGFLQKNNSVAQRTQCSLCPHAPASSLVSDLQRSPASG